MVYGSVTHLEIEACSIVMWRDKEMVCSLRPVPVGPTLGNILNRASHHSWRLRSQGMTPWCKVARCVYWSIEPISFVRI